MSEKRRIVLDTNCLIASLSRHSVYYPVWSTSHFDVLKDVDFPKLLVLKLKEFLGQLQSEDNK